MGTISYRSDIDGLRAIAVLSVILCHAGVPWASGGFTGVDVFFVISGFLITSLILKELKDGTFTLPGFWERRARRILPALAVVVFATLAAGWFLYLPEDYEALGKQVAAQAVFGSNVLFYKEAGYFDSASFLKPLLHTWSLAVEEQFYLLFPLAAFAVWKKARRYFVQALTGLAALSFVLCVIVTNNNTELAFYMLPFRMWELFTGALIAYYAQNPKAVSGVWRNAAALSGLTAILLPVVFYTNETPFPGWAALAPCLGAGAIIWAGLHGQTWVGKVLSLQPVVFVGLVSYSWYLWHWPAIVFAKYIPEFFDAKIAALCVAGSLVAAVLSWKFIETPFRRKTWLPEQGQVYKAAFVTLALFAVAGIGIKASGGMPSRLDASVERYAFGIGDENPHRMDCNKMPMGDIKADKICKTLPESADKPTYILWGDSHADAIAPAFFDLSEKHGRNGYVATHDGCPPITDYVEKEWSGDNNCHEFNLAVFDFIKRHDIKHVFLVASWLSWMDYKGAEPTALLLQRTIDALHKDGVRVYVLLDPPSAGFDPPRVLAMRTLYDRKIDAPLVERTAYLEHRDHALAPFVKKARHAILIDPVDRICPKDACLVEYDGYSLYYNQGHVSTKGALYLAPLFEPYFEKGF